MDPDHSIVRSECPLAECHVKVKRLDEDLFEEHVLSGDRRGDHADHQAKAHGREAAQETIGPTGLGRCP
jgi:hypothetical protein